LSDRRTPKEHFRQPNAWKFSSMGRSEELLVRAGGARAVG
jgi:hypothetical protein